MSVTAAIPPLSNCTSAWPFESFFFFALLLHEQRSHLFSLPGVAFIYEQAYKT